MVPISRSRVFAFCLGVVGVCVFGVAFGVTYVARDATVAELRSRIAERIVTEVIRDDDASVRRAVPHRVARIFNEHPGFARAVLTHALPSQLDAELLREARIVCAANVVVFAMLTALALSRRRLRHDLVVPSALLVGSALVTAYCYLFAQHWLRAIVFDEYVGLGYFVYLAVVFVLLVDVVRRRGRLVRDVSIVV